MNIEGILEFGKRGDPEEKKKFQVDGPVLLDKKTRRVLISDMASAIIFSAPESFPISALKEVPLFYAKAKEDFVVKTAERAAFITTVGDFMTWARSEIDPCPVCGGAGGCPVPPRGQDDKTQEEEDASDLHYGWVGPTSVDRRRIDELLTLTEAPVETPIEVLAVVHHRPHHDHDRFLGICITAKDWEIIIAGVDHHIEAATKFHLSGKFTTPVFKKAKGKARGAAKPMKVKPKTTIVATTSKKAPAKEPPKTKTVKSAKKPEKKMSALEAARARAAARKK